MRQILVDNRKIVLIGLTLSCVLCLELLLKQYRSGQAGDTLVTFYNLRIGAEYITINVIYLLWLRTIKTRNLEGKVEDTCPENTNNNFFRILGSSSLFLLLAFIAYPNTKTDIYTYLHSGLMILHGVNPYIVPAGDFSSPLSSYFAWDQTSTYGPISQLFFVISATFLKTRIFLGLYVFKFFCLLFHVINAFLIWHQLKTYVWRNPLVLAYLVNPVLLFEQVSQAHLDVFLCTSLILLVASIRSHRLFLSVMLIWLGILIKTLPVIWMPLIFLYILSLKKWKMLALSIFASICIVVIVSFSLLGSIDAWVSLTNPGVSGRADRSLHLFLSFIVTTMPTIFPQFLNAYRVYTLSKWMGYLAYIACYAFMLFGIYTSTQESHYSKRYVILCIGWSALLLFLFATPWNPSWYATILVPIAFLLVPINNCDVQKFVNATLIFCLSSSTYYLLTLAGSPDFSLMIDCLIAFLPTSLYLMFPRRLSII